MSTIPRPSARKILNQLHEDDASLIWYLLVAAYAIKTGDIPKPHKITPRGYEFSAYDFDIDHLEKKDIRSLLRRIDK
tara:strand:+ start:348 stop:578 length:231 start_codon:yes stop_codon:yes gene_type:complete